MRPCIKLEMFKFLLKNNLVVYLAFSFRLKKYFIRVFKFVPVVVLD